MENISVEVKTSEDRIFPTLHCGCDYFTEGWGGMSNKFTAQLSIEMWFDCPNCKRSIDLFDVPFMNDDNYLFSFLVGSRYHNDVDGWKKIDREFDCPKCEQEIIFDELEY